MGYPLFPGWPDMHEAYWEHEGNIENACKKPDPPPKQKAQDSSSKKKNE